MSGLENMDLGLYTDVKTTKKNVKEDTTPTTGFTKEYDFGDANLKEIMDPQKRKKKECINMEYHVPFTVIKKDFATVRSRIKSVERQDGLDRGDVVTQNLGVFCQKLDSCLRSSKVPLMQMEGYDEKLLIKMIELFLTNQNAMGSMRRHIFVILAVVLPSLKDMAAIQKLVQENPLECSMENVDFYGGDWMKKVLIILEYLPVQYVLNKSCKAEITAIHDLFLKICKRLNEIYIESQLVAPHSHYFLDNKNIRTEDPKPFKGIMLGPEVGIGKIHACKNHPTPFIEGFPRKSLTIENCGKMIKFVRDVQPRIFVNYQKIGPHRHMWRDSQGVESEKYSFPVGVVIGDMVSTENENDGSQHVTQFKLPEVEGELDDLEKRVKNRDVARHFHKLLSYKFIVTATTADDCNFANGNKRVGPPKKKKNSFDMDEKKE